MFYKSKFQKGLKNFEFQENSKNLVFALKRDFSYLFCDKVEVIKATKNGKEKYFLSSSFKRKDVHVFIDKEGSYRPSIVKDAETCESIEVTNEDLYSESVNKAVEKLKDIGFAEPIFNKKIYDKNGEEYSVEHYKGADFTLSNSALVGDVTFLKKDRETIGYVLTKYFDIEAVKKNYNINEISLDLFKKEYKLFNKTAVVDYSRISEDYQNLGLGKELYYTIIDSFLERKMGFRSSTIQSKEAKRLWESIKREYSNNVKEGKIGDNNFFTIKNNSIPKQNKKKKLRKV